MIATAEDYKQQLLDLLPKGPAWSREGTSTLVLFLHALADELARVHNRGLQLIEEADPRTTTELLADHERVAGLPEPCSVQPPTIDGRRLVLVEKLTRTGGLSAAYFISVAAARGFVITITEFSPSTVLSPVNVPWNGIMWRYVWGVHALAQTLNEFRMSQNGMGDPLTSSVVAITLWPVNGKVNEPLSMYGNPELECLMRRLNPAHTAVIFFFS